MRNDDVITSILPGMLMTRRQSATHTAVQAKISEHPDGQNQVEPIVDQYGRFFTCLISKFT